MPHGEGILTHTDNSTKEGLWHRGEFIEGSSNESEAISNKSDVGHK